MKGYKDTTKTVYMSEGGRTPAWTRKEGKDPDGGLNAKGRASYNRANPGKPGLKRPQPEGGPRRDSFCARMKGMKAKLTSAETARDPNSRINKSLRAWNC
ncbi:MAG: Synechococcus phage [Pseudomonadota bacterium]